MKKPFVLFLAGQGILNLGDSFRFIAVTVLLYKLTGSGVSTALGLVFSAIPSILLSPFAGAAGDKFTEKYLLSVVDLIRGAVVLFLMSDLNNMQIYLVLVALSALDAVYGPPRKKIIISLVGKKDVMQANSLITGVSGAAYLVGPLLAGVVTEAGGSRVAFLASSFTCLISSFILLIIKTGPRNSAHDRKSPDESFFGEIAAGFEYLKSARLVKEVVLISTMAGLCSISINMAFYPFAFDVLGVKPKGWSLIVSVYYGTNLLAMLLASALKGMTPGKLWKVFYAGLASTAVIWMLYGFTRSFFTVLLLQFVEGSILALCGIILVSRMQSISEKSFMARVAGMTDIFSSTAKLAGIGCSYLLMVAGSYKTVFTVNSALLLVVSLAGFIRAQKTSL